MSIFSFLGFMPTAFSGCLFLIILAFLLYVFFKSALLMVKWHECGPSDTDKTERNFNAIAFCLFLLGVIIIAYLAFLEINDGLNRAKIINTATEVNVLIKKIADNNTSYLKENKPTFSVIIDGTLYSSENATFIKFNYDKYNYYFDVASIKSRFQNIISIDSDDLDSKELLIVAEDKDKLTKMAENKARLGVQAFYKSNKTGEFFTYNYIVYNGDKTKYQSIKKISLSDVKKDLSEDKELYKKFIGEPIVY